MTPTDQAGQPLSLLIVHAHPDDESIATGGTLARYAAEGVHTVLVTATLGDEGEIHDPDLTEDEARPRLATIREDELRRAVAVLGIDQLELLGYRDSGMADTPANAHPDNFHNADPAAAVGRLVRLIRQHRPQVVITYNEDGGYPHPDHLQSYRVTQAAFAAAGDPAQYPDAGPAWAPAKRYAIAWSREAWRELRTAMQARGLPFFGEEVEEQAPETVRTAEEDEGEWGQPEETITTFIDTSGYWEKAIGALRQHRTQPLDFMLKLPDDLAAMALSREYFVLLEATFPPTLPEDDLFAGILAEGSE